MGLGWGGGKRELRGYGQQQYFHSTYFKNVRTSFLCFIKIILKDLKSLSLNYRGCMKLNERFHVEATNVQFERRRNFWRIKLLEPRIINE